MRRDSACDVKQALQNMDEYEFENLIADLWTERGWETEVTRSTRDKGVDVVATRSEPFEQKQLIQAKRYGEGNKVSSTEVQQYNSLRDQERGVDSVIIITTSGFSTDAQKMAEQLNVKLIDGESLLQLFSDVDTPELLDQYFSLPSVDSSERSLAKDRDWESEIEESIPDGVRLEWALQKEDEAAYQSISVGRDHLYLGTKHGIIEKRNKKDGTLDWTLQTPDEETCIVHFAEDCLFLGTSSGRISAFSADTGNAIWEKEVLKGRAVSYISDIAVSSDSSVFFVIGLGSGGRLFKIDIETGELLWSKSSSALLNDVICTDDAIYLSNREGEVTSLSAHSGERRWKRTIDERLRIAPSPALYDDILYQASQEETVHQFAVSDGEKRGSVDVGTPIKQTPTVKDGILYAISFEELRAVDFYTGSVEYRHAFEDLPLSSAGDTHFHVPRTSPVVYEKQVVVGIGEPTPKMGDSDIVDESLETGNPKLVAISHDGTLDWKLEIPGTIGHLTNDGRTIYLYTFDGHVLALTSPE